MSSERDGHDLNAQARAWCEQVANEKIKGTRPRAAFEQERPTLVSVIGASPPKGIIDRSGPQALLQRLLEDEYGYRQERSLAYRLRPGRPHWDWSLDTFPFERKPAVSEHQIRAPGGDHLARRAA